MFHAIPFGFAIITSTFAAATDLYGHVEWTCWILPDELFDGAKELTPVQSNFRIIQWVFLFGVVWLCIFYVSIIFVLLFRKMKALEKKLKRYSSPYPSQSSQEEDAGLAVKFSTDSLSATLASLKEIRHTSFPAKEPIQIELPVQEDQALYLDQHDGAIPMTARSIVIGTFGMDDIVEEQKFSLETIDRDQSVMTTLEDAGSDKSDCSSVHHHEESLSSTQYRESKGANGRKPSITFVGVTMNEESKVDACGDEHYSDKKQKRSSLIRIPIKRRSFGHDGEKASYRKAANSKKIAVQGMLCKYFGHFRMPLFF